MAIKRYLNLDEKKGKTRVRRYFVEDTEQRRGVTIETVAETLDDKGKVVGTPKTTSKFLPDRNIVLHGFCLSSRLNSNIVLLPFH